MNELLVEQLFTYEGEDNRLVDQISEQSSIQEEDNFPLLTFPLNQLSPNEENYGSDSYQCPDWPFVHVPDSENEKIKKKKKKSGRKRERQLKEGEKIHDKFGPDNILRKIHVHFMSFILSVVNELLNHIEECPFKFIDIDYKIKKSLLTKKRFQSLKNESIGKILCQKVSTKFRKKAKQNLFKNATIFNQVSKNKIANDFLSKEYITLFRDYYFINKRNYNENGVNFQFSEKVETYENLLREIEKEYDDKDEYKAKIGEVIQKYYFTSVLCLKKKQL